MQASLGTVVTNDPDAPAWLFLRARGPRTFHVLGRINVDERSSTTSKGKAAGAGLVQWSYDWERDMWTEM